jgi:type IX secretion system PorP/SprF family membrane protein
MKAFLIAVLILALPPMVQAQNDPLYAQYLNNPLLINPAYAGFNKTFNLSTAFRKQWAGFDGSPATLALTAHSSLLDNKMGTGLIISQDRIGENTNTFIQAVYSYKINLSSSLQLSFGLQGGLISYRSDNSRLNPYDPTDPLFSGTQITIKPSMGSGVILRGDKFFAGLSVPRMLRVKTDFENTVGTGEVDLYTQHFYAFFSYVFLINERLRFKPATLLRAVPGAPLSADLNALFTIDNKYTGGVFTRNTNTFGFLIQATFSQFRFGYAFEIPTNKSVGTHFTTHDLTLGINIGLFRFHDTLQLSDY